MSPGQPGCRKRCRLRAAPSSSDLRARRQGSRKPRDSDSRRARPHLARSDRPRFLSLRRQHWRSLRHPSSPRPRSLNRLGARSRRCRRLLRHQRVPSRLRPLLASHLPATARLPCQRRHRRCCSTCCCTLAPLARQSSLPLPNERRFSSPTYLAEQHTRRRMAGRQLASVSRSAAGNGTNESR